MLYDILIMKSGTKILYLFGAVSHPELISFLRTQCVFDNDAEIDAVIKDWRIAAEKFQAISHGSSDLPESIRIENLPNQYSSKLKGITDDALFRNSFSIYPYSIQLVEIEKLVAPQRYVNLDYVKKLEALMPDSPDLDFLIDFCLKSSGFTPTPSELQNTPNMYTFRSESVDFRFLGGYKKDLTPDDMRYCVGGGQPVAAIILFVGYGSPAINVFKVGSRIILNNGFHRLYALLRKGVKLAPMVVQHIQNWNLELPPTIAGLPREYLLTTPRPSLMKDFTNSELTKELIMKSRDRVVQIQWLVNQIDMPR